MERQNGRMAERQKGRKAEKQKRSPFLCVSATLREIYLFASLREIIFLCVFASLRVIIFLCVFASLRVITFLCVSASLREITFLCVSASLHEIKDTYRLSPDKNTANALFHYTYREG